MFPVTRTLSELQEDYEDITEFCRENDISCAEHLLAAERNRLNGVKGCTLDEFRQNMLDAIARGAKCRI